MTNSFVSLVAQRKKTFAALGFVVLVAAWWAFRPEKLFINERVDEPAPFASSSGPEPVLTGPLEDAAHSTLGLATIYQAPAGRRYLRISGLSAAPPQLHVALQGTGPRIDLGALQSPQEQSFDLAASVDLNQYNRVAIFSARAGTFATATLQRF
jgi:hypothetical protein